MPISAKGVDDFIGLNDKNYLDWGDQESIDQMETDFHGGGPSFVIFYSSENKIKKFKEHVINGRFNGETPTSFIRVMTRVIHIIRKVLFAIFSNDTWMENKATKVLRTRIN